VRYSLFTIFLVGCSQFEVPNDPRDIHGVDPAFASYVQEFEVQYGASIGDIPIQFAPQSGYVIGECIIWSSQYREIKVDPDFWKYGAVDDDEREALISHELGHCVLNRAHLNTDWNDPNDGDNSMPTSLMNAYIFFNDLYPDWQSLKVYYYNELFHPAPGVPMLSVSEDLLDYTDFKTKNFLRRKL
jgi:hypothetical protein